MKKTKTGHVDDKANKLHAIASLRVLLDATKEQAVANGRDPNEEVNAIFLIITATASTILNSLVVHTVF
jgi:hypothetical protein